MRRSALAVVLAAAPVWLGACSFVLSFSGIDDGTQDGGGEAGESPDVAADVGANDQTTGSEPDGPSTDAVARDSGVPRPDAAQDATMDTVNPVPEASADARPDSGDSAAPDAGPCPPGLPGPSMVPVGSFCIDSTEVTLGQYEAFLTAKAGDTSGQPVTCQWNSSYTPLANWPPAVSAPPDQAMRGVDWCDAYMYCAWAGKRLCGNADGGSSDPNNVSNPAVSQWFRACSHGGDGLHVYPYGLQYDASACNGLDRDAQGPLPAQKTCEGAYPGLFDMSGNVIEWEDSCLPTPTSPDAGDTSGASDYCNLRGGSFLLGSAGLTCGYNIYFGRAGGGGDNGFRCCSR
jgi:formylglycine-generating enzyme required for sulfatase activity